jgi:hypothetical protein
VRAGLGTALESAATAYSPVGGIKYCVDPKTGELQTYSIAPGIYNAYDYTNALPFHGQTLPRRIAVMEGQRRVRQIQLDSIQDPGPVDQGLLMPTQAMFAAGPGLTNFWSVPVSADGGGTRWIRA